MEIILWIVGMIVIGYILGKLYQSTDSVILKELIRNPTATFVIGGALILWILKLLGVIDL
tara:strand:+ start:190 stop:369 length:180 start_codon:yes stop_codon:yes gene_type:complete